MLKIISRLRQTRLAHMLGFGPKEPMGAALEATIVCSGLLLQQEFQGCRLEVWRKGGLKTPKEEWVHPIIRFPKGELAKIEAISNLGKPNLFQVSVWDQNDRAIWLLKIQNDMPKAEAGEFIHFPKNPPSYGNLRYCAGAQELKATLVKINELLQSKEHAKAMPDRTLAQIEMGN